jgi:hypothetical protein
VVAGGGRQGGREGGKEWVREVGGSNEENIIGRKSGKGAGGERMREGEEKGKDGGREGEMELKAHVPAMAAAEVIISHFRRDGLATKVGRE